MSERLVQMLGSLKDVDGVLGSVVWSHDGHVVARALPEYIDSAVLGEVGPRLQRICDAFQSAGNELDSATLMFESHKLHLRRLQSGLVAVLSTIAINAPALKMAWSLVGRRLDTAIAEATDEALLAAQSARVAADAEANRAAQQQADAAAAATRRGLVGGGDAESQRKIIFRGKRLIS